MPRQKLKMYDKQINIRLSEAEYKDLNEKAAKVGMTVSAFIRDLIWRS